MVCKGTKKQTKKNPDFFHSLRHAVNGIRTVYRDERNMRYHTMIGIIPLLLAWFFHVSSLEWILLIFCIFFVVLMEFLNTVTENVVDLIVDHQYHILAKKAKDIAAGSVLITAAFTVIVAGIIFIPKVIDLLVTNR